MFENLLYQNTSKLLIEDIKKNMLPNSLLFSGPVGTGKLTAALELARILSCKSEGSKKGDWSCACSSCLKHKALTSTDVLITGPRDCTLEISAAKDAYIRAIETNSQFRISTNYLFVRSVRKLTSRFNPVFYEGDDKVSKISPYIQTIDELLEEFDPLRPIEKLGDIEKIKKNAENLLTQCEKLESSFMYDSVPVSHIRNASSWARFTTSSGKKVLIIENADRMLETVRNALLKILEEPPEDTLFILTTSKRGAVMPTILSRVRTYPFIERTEEQNKDVISRVFHDEGTNINDYLCGFLPVSKEKIKELSVDFLTSINNGVFPKIDVISKEVNQFEPRVILSIFLNSFFAAGQEKIRRENFTKNDILFAEKQQTLLKSVKKCYENVTIFNQNPVAALENLAGELIG